MTRTLKMAVVVSSEIWNVSTKLHAKTYESCNINLRKMGNSNMAVVRHILM